MYKHVSNKVKIRLTIACIGSKNILWIEVDYDRAKLKRCTINYSFFSGRFMKASWNSCKISRRILKFSH